MSECSCTLNISNTCIVIVPAYSKGCAPRFHIRTNYFTISVNNLCNNLSNAAFHFYADDTVIYCSSSSIEQSLDFLQSAFYVIPSHLSQLKLVLNADKSKLMIFSNGKKLTSFLPNICTVQGTDIERVTTYKYLGFIIDQNLSFKSQTENVVSKQNIKFCFFNREKSCVSFQTRTYLISATFLPVLDYGGLLYMKASEQCLKTLDTVHHCALRFCYFVCCC